MFNITVNKDKIFEYKEENGRKILNNVFVEADIQSIGDNQYHILYKGNSYRAELLEFDHKKCKVRINGKTMEVAIKDRNDILLDRMGLSASSHTKIQEIKAPMPGLIIDIKVNVGDEIKNGAPLLVLEAMKMENIIKSPCDGIIEQIFSAKGDIVEKNTLLIKFHL
jgi:biotin carboxyl carrier protein